MEHQLYIKELHTHTKMCEHAHTHTHTHADEVAGEISAFCLFDAYLNPISISLVCLPFSDLTEWHVDSAVLAVVDGEAWPLHKPLTSSCSLSLLTFKDTNPLLANQV